MDTAELNHLRWRCTHRAMLEMDFMLGNFLDNHFSNLTAEQSVEFAKLVEMEDQDLRPLILGKRVSDHAVRAEVLAMLRDVRLK
jgi:succinate dehydrogenase flavin-adding protein (antitoxin of CptAB toxin-antitoxin module)